VEGTRKVKILDLKTHPRQRHLFAEPSFAEIELLANDMRVHGLKHPIEVLPDGTVLCGHSRVEAAKFLQWEEIDAIVRHDLVGASDLEVEQHMITDNYLRRQLRPLERAHCALRLKELAHGGGLDHLSPEARSAAVRNVRGWVGSLLRISGREVSRLLRVLQTPLAIQQAYDDGRLSLVMAGKVADLSDDDQRQLVQAIRTGESPKDAVRRFTTPPRTQTNDANGAYKRLLRQLTSAATAISPHVGGLHVDAADVDRHLSTLQAGTVLLDELKARIGVCRQEQEQALDEALNRITDDFEQIGGVE
jgi:hypothetical protein